mmetsp:Transcript_44781/g.40026  ORF Transcript_44781/g.40026 Transcript_44781/m.40026 type:complete len:146 (-) Transcript_44781:95-532(-)
MYCNPMSPQYDVQDCIDFGGAAQLGQTGFGGQPGVGQGNPMTNMYCNPISPQYDLQDCIQFGGQPAGLPGFGGQPGFGQQTGFAPPTQGGQPATPGAPAVGQPGIGGGIGGRPGMGVNPMIPECNPYSGNYHIQDCYEIMYGIQI